MDGFVMDSCAITDEMHWSVSLRRAGDDLFWRIKRSTLRVYSRRKSMSVIESRRGFERPEDLSGEKSCSKQVISLSVLFSSG